jgi:hypothetical protein
MNKRDFILKMEKMLTKRVIYDLGMEITDIKLHSIKLRLLKTRSLSNIAVLSNELRILGLDGIVIQETIQKQTLLSCTKHDLVYDIKPHTEIINVNGYDVYNLKRFDSDCPIPLFLSQDTRIIVPRCSIKCVKLLEDKRIALEGYKYENDNLIVENGTISVIDV